MRAARRLASLALVAAASALALAASGGSLTAQPTVVVVDANVATTGSDAWQNSGASSVTVSSIALSPCDDPAAMAIVSPGGAFSVGAGSTRAVTFGCASGGPFGLKRCTYHGLDALSDELVSFKAVCATTSSAVLAPSTTSVTFAGVAVGSTAAQTVTITNTGANAGAIGTLQLQTTDLAGNIELGAPCAANVDGCDVTNAALGSFTVDVLCHPTAATTFNAQVYVVDSLGDTLTAPIAVSCTGTPQTSATISVTTEPSPLDVGRVEVLGPAKSGTVRVANVGTAGTLTLSAIAISGAGTDWTYTLPAPCTSGLPCGLAPGVAVAIPVNFKPSAIGARDATLSISSSDPNNAQVDVQLHGIGQGATLEQLAGDPATFDFGSVPASGSASVSIHLVNNGNRDLTDATLALTSAPQFSTMPAPSPPALVVARGATPTTVTLTCAPGGATGTFMTTVTASAPDTVGNAPIAIAATCKGTNAPLLASPSSIQLGEVRVDTTTMVPIMVKNVGASTLTLSAMPALTPANPALSLGALASMSIPAGGAQTLQLAVAPTAAGTLAASITASDSAGDTLAIPITGTAVTATVAAPSTVSLGTFCVSQPTTPTTIALTSTGDGRIVLQAPHLATLASPFHITPQSPSLYPAALAAHASATLDVQPNRQGSAISVGDDVVWATDLATDPTPTTHVTAQFLAAGAAIAPQSLTFGQTSIHLYTKDAQAVTIQNCSGPTISLTQTVDPPFSIDTAFPTQLAADEVVTFSVGFHPTKTGMFAGKLHITASDGSTLAVDLAGEGVADLMPPDAGSGGGPPTRGSSFYACSCRAASPGGAAPVLLAMMCVLFPRRRRRRGGIG